MDIFKNAVSAEVSLKGYDPGKVVLYRNLTFERNYYGVILERLEDGFRVMMLTEDLKPKTDMSGLIMFDIAHFANIYSIKELPSSSRYENPFEVGFEL